MNKCITEENITWKEMDISLIFTEIKELAEELLKNQSIRDVEDVIEKLFVKVTALDEVVRNNTTDTQVEEYAINLWNWAVTKRLESSINNEQRTKLRHVACKLVSLCDNAEPNEVTLQRQILMFMKTGKSWLDCRKPLLADGFLDLALKSLEMLYARLIAGYDGQSDLNVLKNDVEKDLFKVHSYQAESAVTQCDHMNAVNCIQRCKDMLRRIPKETGYLALLCYNFGVDTYQQKKYEESAFWLSQSYDIGKIDKRYSPGSPVQAKVLRLLANVYLEWDIKQHQERALNAVILANQENPHPAGLFLKIKILLKGIFPDAVISAGNNLEVITCEFLKSVCCSFALKIESLTQAQEHIQVCWDIWRALKSTTGGDVSNDPTETLLLLYEFEARAKLNDPKIENVLEKVLQLQKIEPKTLETLASLAMESPAHYPSVCKKALKIALSLQKKQPDKDVIRCSKLLHSLVQISLPTGLTEIEPRVLDEVWWYYEEALVMIENSQEEYPEVEMLWLMTRAWNTGASLYSLGKYAEAEKWCGLGMRFLKYLGSLQASYESQTVDSFRGIKRSEAATVVGRSTQLPVVKSCD
ncbi:testis-expressed protein 11 [Rhincodon typus]|uniref:testis-expressed protein 11 n=1 Tax=Rhincodon typus TaxID=259920 RepID=UPI00202E23EE|nr:testis-expressed protein 11 [Rhincodon typus]